MKKLTVGFAGDRVAVAIVAGCCFAISVVARPARPGEISHQKAGGETRARAASDETKRFVLLHPLVIERSLPGSGIPVRDTISVSMPSGSFEPIAQDQRGVYYEAKTPFLSRDGRYRLLGGIYVEKADERRIWIYLGDARPTSRWGVYKKDQRPLFWSELQNFGVQKAGR